MKTGLEQQVCALKKVKASTEAMHQGSQDNNSLLMSDSSHDDDGTPVSDLQKIPKSAGSKKRDHYGTSDYLNVFDNSNGSNENIATNEDDGNMNSSGNKDHIDVQIFDSGSPACAQVSPNSKSADTIILKNLDSDALLLISGILRKTRVLEEVKLLMNNQNVLNSWDIKLMLMEYDAYKSGEHKYFREAIKRRQHVQKQAKLFHKESVRVGVWNLNASSSENGFDNDLSPIGAKKSRRTTGPVRQVDKVSIENNGTLDKSSEFQDENESKHDELENLQNAQELDTEWTNTE